MPRFVDLSVPIENGVASDPEYSRPEITYLGHGETIDRMRASFPDLTPEHLPDGAAWAIEKLTVTTHHGTHLDAPWHFHPTTNHALGPGERSPTIDEIPLDWCFRPGVKLDFRGFADGTVATALDVERELSRIGHTLQPYDIVVVNTRAGVRYGADDYVRAGCGMGREATLYLTEHGVRVTGTDGWSWDAPFIHTRKRWEETRDPSIIWEGHRASMAIGYCHIEKLANLDQLPSTGFTVSCFPFKIKGASAGFVRAVAIFED